MVFDNAPILHVTNNTTIQQKSSLNAEGKFEQIDFSVTIGTTTNLENGESSVYFFGSAGKKLETNAGSCTPALYTTGSYNINTGTTSGSTGLQFKVKSKELDGASITTTTRVGIEY